MIEIHQLRYAVATADARSFSRAAATLNVKQITLSRRVKLLEDRLGVKLFERTTRGAETTENGRPFIEQARRIITDVDNLQTTARNVSYGLRGRIAVGYCSPIMAGNLKLAISDYLTKFEDVQFDGIEAGLEKLFHGLHSHVLDVAVAPIGLEEDGIASRRIWSERLYAVLPFDHALMEKEQIYWQDLRREAFVVPAGGLGPVFGNLITARLTEQGKRPSIIVQDTSLESVLSMVAAKRYISVATEASQGVTWTDLRFLEIHDPTGPTRLEYALYWRRNNENPALQRFFKLIDERYPG
ncbi:LysR family transcriptional regulator [Sphingobium sp. H39-3-25]|uniref:LysR family transcriptional regulator n=1 Tax=Sphingobium arseniciresistens TaxID=3030834 RepID=UPI0023B8AA3E|nr:LysR family transcriptional regulator [Sphingobium arseniciresistens]